MQIVINISEESYKFARECKFKGSSKHNWNLSHDNIVLMIANGAPLPKGHGRLIDADNIIFSQFFDAGDYAQAMRGIYNARTIIEADKAESEGVNESI